MDTADLKLAIIVGSARQGRFGPVVARWFTGEAQRHGQFTVDVVDVAAEPLPVELPSGQEALRDVASRHPDMVALARRLDEADAFVVVTPEYNHSIPASLKHFIDWHFTEWQAKPVGFVSYAGLGGGVRAVEHLRGIFAELHAVTVRDSVAFSEFWTHFDEEGNLVEPQPAELAAKALLDQLLWWGRVLHQARSTAPYGISP